MVLRVFRKFGGKGKKHGLEVITEFEAVSPNLQKLEPLVQFVQKVAPEDEVPTALALKLLILKYSKSPRVAELLSMIPEKIEKIEKPAVLIDSYKYATFIVKELEKRISELPYSNEKKQEILEKMVVMIQGVLYTRALQKAKSPSDLQKISDAFFVPLPTAEKHWKMAQTQRPQRNKVYDKREKPIKIVQEQKARGGRKQ